MFEKRIVVKLHLNSYYSSPLSNLGVRSTDHSPVKLGIIFFF